MQVLVRKVLQETMLRRSAVDVAGQVTKVGATNIIATALRGLRACQLFKGLLIP